jgi:hypothetical protein
MTNQTPQTHRLPVRLLIDSEERIRLAMEEYRRSLQEEKEVLARGEPIFIIPEPNQWELDRRQRHEARQKWLQEQPEFYIPSN